MNPESKDGPTMLTLFGAAVSPGLAMGNMLVYIDILHRDQELFQIAQSQVRDEQAGIDRAVADVRESLEIDAKHIEAKLNKESAAIFHAQAAMLVDSSVIKKLKAALESELLDAEQVVRLVFRRLARKFRAMDQEVFRDRGDDIDDLSRRLLLSLGGIHAHSLENLPANTVLVARRLLPSDTVFLSRSSTVGVLAEFAGPAAHAALLAREMGIPCVGEIPNLLGMVQTGDLVLVNGTTGKAVVNPDSLALECYQASLEEIRNAGKSRTREELSEPATTWDGIEISVMANVRSREDVELAVERGADGIGLFRTEPFFLSTKHMPSDHEFAKFLAHSLEPMRGKECNVRLLDIGADKNPLYLHLPPEPDPFLGRRGFRILREYPELLEAQLRALLMVSRDFSIGILIPMVTLETDVTEVIEVCRRLQGDLDVPVLPRLGAMIETPAAALSIPCLKRHVDFFSIGTNDLTQYTMAAGRENPLVSEYFVHDHPVILRLIELVIQEAGEVPVSICGELAGQTEAIPRLVKTGIRSVSVSASLVSDVKNAIRDASP